MRRLLALVVWLVLGAQAAAQERYFDSGGVRLRYVERGAGAAVVLVHGFTGQLERPWVDNGLLDELARGYRVVAFDLRGHGRSDKPGDAAAYADIGVDVLRLMDYLGIARAHLVGYSLGGIIAAKLLTTDAHRFSSAVIAAAAHRRGRGPESERAAEADAIELERGPIPYRSLILSTAPTHEPRPDDVALGAISAAIVARGDYRLAHAALLRARRSLLVRDEELAAVRVAALVIVGSADPALPRIQRMTSMWPSARLVIVPGATHPVAHPRSLAQRREFVDAVRDFIAASDSAGASSRPPIPSSRP
ncbi:MAG: alpha/beta fold hydrolase [Betaproteobacteria bacterium]